jgi:hypothetical protein
VHLPIYKTLLEKHVLERARDRLQGLRLPRTLTLKVEGCNGDINAAYEPADATLTICYEYLAYIQEFGQKIPPALLKKDLTLANYVVDPFFEVLLHEMAHAIFDLKKVPILGREEDAADQVAAFLLLRLGKGETRRVIASIAVMYASERVNLRRSSKISPTSTACRRNGCTTSCASATARIPRPSAASSKKVICRASAPNNAMANIAK